MKRVFYIANNHDGSYFVLSDNLNEYYQRLSAYAMNLKNSKKTNHYSFGSVEMTSNEYLKEREKCNTFERERIKLQQVAEIKPEVKPEITTATSENSKDNVIPLFQ